MSVRDEVTRAGSAARAAHPGLATAAATAVAEALHGMALGLRDRADAVLAANAADVAAAEGSLAPALVDRLRLDLDRLGRMSDQIAALAALGDVEELVGTRALPGGLVMRERRRPVGVIGANYEARPNVTVDVASQLIKSRNAGVLRTGAAALRSAIALRDEVIAPAMERAGLDPAAIQLVRSPDREAARALVSLPRLIPLVILRGSGETTASLAREAAAHGVRTLAHAEGGGVLYIDARRRPRPGARPRRAQPRPSRGLQPPQPPADRRGLLGRAAAAGPAAARAAGHPRRPAAARPPPRARVGPRRRQRGDGDAWRPPPGRSRRRASPTTRPRASPRRSPPRIPLAAEVFLAAYAGTGAFWNATTRLLDGFELLGAPETGINVDHVPGPRGPVTFRDLHLRQYVVGAGMRSAGFPPGPNRLLLSPDSPGRRVPSHDRHPPHHRAPTRTDARALACRGIRLRPVTVLFAP